MDPWYINLLKNRAFWLSVWAVVKIVLTFIPAIPANVLSTLDVLAVTIIGLLTVDSFAVKLGAALRK